MSNVYIWIGSSGSDWQAPTNWSGGAQGAIPGPGDTVEINAANFAASGETVAAWYGGGAGYSSHVTGYVTVTGLIYDVIFDAGVANVGTFEATLGGGTVSAHALRSTVTGGVAYASVANYLAMYGGKVSLSAAVTNTTYPGLDVNIHGGTFSANGITLALTGTYIDVFGVDGGTALIAGNALIDDGGGANGPLVAMGLGTGGGLLSVAGSITVAGKGAVNVNGGTLASSGALILAAGYLDQGGSGIVLTRSADLGTAGEASAQFNGPGSWNNSGTLIVGDASTASLRMERSAALSVGGDLVAGLSAGAKGSLAFFADTQFVAGSLSIGVAGYGVLGASGGGVLNIGGDLLAGQSAAAGANIGISASTVTVAGNVTLGVDGHAYLGQYGASGFTVGGSMTLGAGAGSGTFVGAGTIHGDLGVANGYVEVAAVSPASPLTLAVGGAIAIGEPAGGKGYLLLGSGMVLSGGTGDVTVGGEGRGTLAILSGATFDAGASTITAAESASGTGTISVEGTNALLVAASLAIGGAGTASATPAALLSVSFGGTVDAGASFEVGADAGGFGQATLTDAGSALSASGFSVGGDGTGVLAVQPGAMALVGGDAAVGENATGKGTWSVNGGAATIDGTLTVGDSGNGLGIVQLGGTLQAAAIEIGNKLGGKGELDVTGANLTSGDLSVGSGGSAKLKITGGDVTTTGNVDIAEQVLGSTQAVSVTGAATWGIAGTLSVAAAGIAGVNVNGGSVASVNGDVVVGDQPGASGVLTLSGTATVGSVTKASELAFGGVLAVGNGGSGTLSVQSGAVLAATAGGTGEIDIAVAAGSTGDLAFGDAGSTLSGTLLDVGGDANTAGGSGTLSLAMGSIFDINRVHIWQSGTVIGAGTIAAAIEDAGMVRADGGTLRLTGDVTGPGTLAIGAGGVMALGGTVSAPTLVTFTGSGQTLEVTGTGTVTGAIGAFGLDDTIIAPGSITGDTTGPLGTTLDIAGGGTLFLAGTLPATPVLNGDTAYIACFASGTRIMTARGEVAVEHLRKGDLVATATGTAPIVWLGHSCLDCRRHPRPWDVRPVRVAAGAFAPGVPRRDLLLSPDHAVFVDGSLIPVRYLINGATIAQEEADAVTYWHVELPEHGVLLAEGLPCESFLDTGNRPAFADGGTGGRVEPDAALAVWAARGCAPLVTEGEALLAARQRLFERALTMGHAPEDDPGLHLLADGRVIRPASVGGRRYRFALDRACRSVRLASRAAAPAETRPESGDHRRLGVMVTRLALRQGDARREIPLGILDGAGWHTVEGEGAWRWTDGDAALPLATAEPLELEVELGAWARPWRRPAPATRARA